MCSFYHITLELGLFLYYHVPKIIPVTRTASSSYVIFDNFVRNAKEMCFRDISNMKYLYTV